MRRSARALLWAAAAAVSALGCRSNCDLVERELHARELDLQAAREEIDRCHALNDGLQAELQTLHGDPAACPPGDSDKPAFAAYPIRSLALGRQTGGRDGDACGGDEALQVVVQPLDADNQPVKAPGSLLIQALEITPAGLKQPLSSWQIPEDELRRSWRSGLLSTGYVLVLPWKVWPNSGKVPRRRPVPSGRRPAVRGRQGRDGSRRPRREAAHSRRPAAAAAAASAGPAGRRAGPEGPPAGRAGDEHRLEPLGDSARAAGRDPAPDRAAAATAVSALSAADRSGTGSAVRRRPAPARTGPRRPATGNRRGWFPVASARPRQG